MKLKRDIYSTFNSKHKYAGAGDEVKIIGTVIVEGADGVCANFARGKMEDVQMMLLELMQNHDPFAEIILELPKIYKRHLKTKTNDTGRITV